MPPLNVSWSCQSLHNTKHRKLVSWRRCSGDGKMRITVWNINGLRTLKGYQPWFKLADWEACLEHLGADIACFQETKMTRKQLVESMCILPSYHTFFNFHPLKGYSGTVTYVRKSVSIPLKAEQGITGRLTPTEEEAIGCNPIDTRDDIDTQLYQALDDEGRAVVLDLGMFILFNLYAPNETGPERLEYKMTYYKCLAERAHRLIEAGRQVMIVGDMNIIRDPIDHCDPEQSMKEHNWTHFHQHPARSWFKSFLAPHGKFHDVGRMYHPQRRKMFTCWNTLIDARPANFGVRLDYTLVTEGLLPWIKGADIQADIYGSDHCPVYIDMYDERVIDGKTVLLKDLMNGGVSTPPPPLAACFYDEFSSKQRKLASYFSSAVPKKGSSQATMPIQTAPSSASTQAEVESEPSLAEALFALQSQSTLAPSQSTSIDKEGQILPTPPPTRAVPTYQRPTVSPRATSSSKKQAKPVKGQKSLQSFFGKPREPSPSPKLETSAKEDRQLSEAIAASAAMVDASANGSEIRQAEVENILDTSANDEDSIQDFQDGASEYDPIVTSSQPSEKSAAERVGASLAWGAIFSPAPAPVCRLHSEACRAWTVNKPGPNHGRKFWLCARPVGPGYEKSGRAKTDVNPEYRCNFFVWDADLKSEATRKKRKQSDTPTPISSPQKLSAASEGTFFADLGREHKKSVESGKAVQTGYAWGPHRKVRPDGNP